jgi:probable HAF family extracellular repeat protein
MVVEVLEDRWLPSSYTITDIGPIAPFDDSGLGSSSGINNAAVVEVVGTTTDHHPYHWDSVHGMQDLGTVGTDQEGGAFSVNDAGQVVGYSYTLTTRQAHKGGPTYTTITSQHAFLWTSAQGMQDLGSNDAASGINASGEASGGVGGGSNAQAALWHGNWTKLGTLGGPASGGSGINSFGQVVGGADIAAPTGYHITHAFLWTPSTAGGTKGTMIDLGTLGTALSNNNSWATAVNNQGTVVGMTDVGSGASDPFVWVPTAPNRTTGTMLDLRAYGGGSANAINNSGAIVGASDPDGTGDHAILWQQDSSGTYHVGDLNTLIPTGTGWLLVSADAINDRGQIVVEARQASGPNHALLLTPTTTTTLALSATATSPLAVSLLTSPGVLALSPQAPPVGATDSSKVPSLSATTTNSSTPSASAQPSSDTAARLAPRWAKPGDVLDQLFAQWDTALSLDG